MTLDNDYNLDIIPAKGVGKFQLGWDLDTLKKNLDGEYTCEWVQDEICMIENDDFKFHLNKDQGLYCIYVMNNFKGKFRELIGIGTVLSELKREIDYEVDDEFLQETMWWRFHIPSVKGIHFVPEQEWNDDTPIDFISVFIP